MKLDDAETAIIENALAAAKASIIRLRAELARVRGERNALAHVAVGLEVAVDRGVQRNQAIKRILSGMTSHPMADGSILGALAEHDRRFQPGGS